MLVTTFPKNRWYGAEITRQEAFAIAPPTINSSPQMFNEQDRVPQKKKGHWQTKGLQNIWCEDRQSVVIYTNKLFQLCFNKNTDDNKQGEN